MAYKFKETAKIPERISGGHRMCAGCGAPVTVRTVLRAIEPEHRAVISVATGCLEVSTCIYPYTSWQDSFIHSAFENAAATISGAESAYRVLKAKGKAGEETKFIAFGGDGGTYDIGLQSLSGAMERGHNMTYVCYDNEAYMNTGIQRSSSTPMYANTTTSPVGEVRAGKIQFKKDLTMIMAAHNIPYVAQSAPYRNMKDLYEKSKKAIYTDGPAFLNVISPCPRGWRYDTPKLMEIIGLAIDSCIWPLYEVENGKFRLTHRPNKKVPVREYLKMQGRFSHLLNGNYENHIDEIQAMVDERWERLLELCGEN